MSKKYFIIQFMNFADRNKLDTDIRNYTKGLLDSRVMTADQLRDAWKQLKTTAQNYNEKYARVSKKVEPIKMDLIDGKDATLLIISDTLHYIAYEVRENLADLALQRDVMIEFANWMWDNAMQAEETGCWITPSKEPGVIPGPISSFDLVFDYTVNKVNEG